MPESIDEIETWGGYIVAEDDRDWEIAVGVAHFVTQNEVDEVTFLGVADLDSDTGWSNVDEGALPNKFSDVSFVSDFHELCEDYAPDSIPYANLDFILEFEQMMGGEIMAHGIYWPECEDGIPWLNEDCSGSVKLF